MIGEELAAMRLEPVTPVIVIASSTVRERYTLAFMHLGVPTRLMGNEAAWAGLHGIYRQLPINTYHA